MSNPGARLLGWLAAAIATVILVRLLGASGILIVIAATLILGLRAGVGSGSGNWDKSGRKGKAMFGDLWRKLGGRPDTPRTAAPDRTAPTAPAQPTGFRIDVNDPRIPTTPRKALVDVVAQIERLIAGNDGDILKGALLIDVETMRDTHLPRLIQSYIEIPEEHRRQIFQQTQKSASVHLTEALATMKLDLDRISKALAQDNISTFQDNMRFISNRYGKRDGEI